LWAGLVALMNERTGRPIGFLNPLIYSQAAQASGFRDITHGDNGSFSAATGWDPCTGLGSPDGAQLMAVVTGAPSVAVRAKSAAAKAGAGNKSSASKKPAA
jgi:kumamolisin